MKMLLYMTLGGSALALLLLALRYVFLRRMPSTVYYYAWLLVLLRFALPLPGLIPTEKRQSESDAVTQIYTAVPFEEEGAEYTFIMPRRRREVPAALTGVRLLCGWLFGPSVPYFVWRLPSVPI